MPSSLSIDSPKLSSPNWLKSSLTSFWQGVNWENVPPPTSAKGDAIDRHLSVKAFFQSIPWVITTTAASPLVSAPVPEQGKEAQDTLDDFLQDISAFF
jgi:hypothetical protein